MRDWVIFALFIVCFCFISKPVKSEESVKYLVYYYSFEVRIVLTDIPCPENQGWRAVAQRIDHVTIPGCWVQDPHNAENVRLDWNNGDFSVFEMEKFKPFFE